MRISLLILFFASISLTGCNASSPSARIQKDEPAINQGSTPGAQDTLMKNNLERVLDNSTPENIRSFENKPSNNYDYLRKSTVAVVKEKLPLLIDETTMITDVSTSQHTLVYGLEVKGVPDSALKKPEVIAAMRSKILNVYCTPSTYSDMLKEVFDAGVQYNYKINKKIINTITITPTDCNAHS